MPGPAVPENYRKALGDRDPLEMLTTAASRVKELVRGLSEAQLSRPEGPGKWSIKQVIAHLADGEVVYGGRLRFIAGHDRPPIPGYDQDAFVEKLGVENATAADLLESFDLARRVNLELRRRLPPAAFDRVGLHAERGEESIATIYAMLAGHDLVHEQQIERIRRGFGA